MIWSDYYMGMAWFVASKSKDPSTKVGAVIVGGSNAVLATGFNGPPQGVEDRPERFERPAKYDWTAHAERNAIDRAAREGVRLKGARMFVTHRPCNECTKSIIQAGIECVTVGSGRVTMDLKEQVAREMLSEAGVKVEHSPVGPASQFRKLLGIIEILSELETKKP